MRKRPRRLFATIFLLLFSIQTFYPAFAFALTSGPAQPEMQKFAVAGIGDMVDVFSGDFKQNIPLVDVGGYPINLSYHSGASLEEEASWVGAGWSVNPGSVNRNLRGLPDDFNGDGLQKTYFKKDFKKAGGQILVKPTFWGFDDIINPPSFKLDVYKDNYYGIGASFGASVSFNLGESRDTKYTAGLDFSSDSRDGVNVRPSFDMITSHDDDFGDQQSTTLSGSLLYNTRGGLKSYSLDASFSSSVMDDDGRYHSGDGTLFSFTHYFGQTYTPSFPVNSTSSSYTLSVDLGPYLFGGYLGLGGSGYVYSSKTTDKIRTSPAYGYLNYLNGRGNTNAVLDFNREKDGTYFPSAPSIGIPVATQDMFSMTGQSGTGQFRPFCSGNYTVFDPKHSDINNDAGAKISVGGGWNWQLGGRLDFTHGQATTKKWTDQNGYLASGEFNKDATNPLDETVYFKQVGETTQTDPTWYNLIGGANAEEVQLSPLNPFATTTALKSSTGLIQLAGKTVKRTQRDRRNFAFNYLSADQATKAGLDRSLPIYPGHVVGDYNTSRATMARTDPYRKPYHMSEISVTDNAGKRMIYGIPVYNRTQQEYSFAVNHPVTTDLQRARRTGVFNYTTADINTKNPVEASPGKGNQRGRDGLLQKEVTPAYATSFLLSGVLSPDYVDLTGDGITDDDPGTAYKFNYNTPSYTYKWRAPFGRMAANFNDELISDPKDDKGNIAYGEKELWYLRSVESKTMIAIFSTSNRKDGLGVLDEDGGINTAAPMMKLDSISLFSKADWAKNGAAAIPIKVAHFLYDYSVCPHMPNNIAAAGADPDPLNQQGGKLTLRKVYFTFGANTRGTTNPYIFDYNFQPVNPGAGTTGLALPSYPVNSTVITPSDNAEASDFYAERQGDRWGTYKQSWYNNNSLGNTTAPNTYPAGYLNNTEFPYSLQKNAPPAAITSANWSDLLDRMASKWQLSSITTPSGSVITVTYECKDYAYVQDKEAMQMYFIQGFEDAGQNPTTDVIHSQYVDVQLPVPIVATGTAGLSEFVSKYLDGTNTLYFKVNTNMKGDLSAGDFSYNEYVNGYATVDPTKCVLKSDQRTIKLFVNQISGYSPIVKLAWQKIKTDLPQYAYNGYDNSDLSGSDLSVIGQAIYWTLVNFRELWNSFDNLASKAHMANNVDLSRSLVRLKSPSASVSFSDGTRTFSKTGGGVRVRKLQISDQWAIMAGSGAKTANYGQEYVYTTTNNLGNTISSGVASYEPQGGNEENPFHQPVPFTEKVLWGIDKYHFIEKPYCESYFPAPVVGYGKITVTAFGDGNARETGYTVNEYYTAKDFPTLVDNLTLDHPSNQHILPLLFFTTASYNQSTSQGFKIELNDMHGKPKSVHVFDKAGREISSSEYFYRVQDQGAEKKQLNNDGVPVLASNGSIDAAGSTMGTDIDFVTDSRQSQNENIGGSLGIYPGGFVIPIPPPFGPWYIPTFGAVPYVTYTNKNYYSTATIKVISRYGLLSKVRTMKNGSSVTAENTLWDPQTGEVLLTRTQNEFNDYTYAFHYPAYLAYDGMGSAARNLGASMPLTTDATTGEITIAGSLDPKGYLFPGDELVSVTTGLKGWVITPAIASRKYQLIDQNGNFILNTSGTYLLMRSGRRNLLDASVGSVISMTDPTIGGQLSPDISKQILDARTVLYKERWSMPQYCLPVATYSTPTGLSTACTTVCEGDQNTAYNQCGTQIYAAGFNAGTGAGTVIYWLSSPFWGGNCGGGGAAAAAKVSAARKTSTTNDSLQSLSAASSAVTTAAINAPVSGTVGKAVTLVSTGACSQTPGTRAALNNYPLSRAGIWSCMGSSGGRQPVATDIKFAACFTAPSSKTYYIGLSADNYCAALIDNIPVVSLYTTNTSFNYWTIYPVTLSAGQHTLTLQAQNQSGSATVACEIYNNTAAELSTATSYTDLTKNNTTPLLFTTRDALGQNLRVDQLSCPVGSTLTTCGGTPTCVTPPPPTILNPYYKDMLGNWHADTSYVYIVNRVQNPAAPGNGGTSVRQSGYYSSYTPFWQFGTGALQNQSYLDNRWIWNKAPIHYDPKGNAIEDVDALGRFSSTIFGFSQSLPTAVSANARHNEIAFDGFEDYNFNLLMLGQTAGCSPGRQLDWGFSNQGGIWTSTSGTISNTIAHSGKWSFKLNATATLVKPLGNSTPLTSFLGYDGTGRYLLTGDEQAAGFAPLLNKKYLISLWVNEDYPATNPTSNAVQKLDIRVNGTSIMTSASSQPVPVVEGWKRIEATFTVTGGSFQLDIVPQGAIYIDDLRILPFDGHMNSFVYNDTNLRLMAQLDENNFATFYEYDEEGTPIRMKKETERGIMTVKETRQSLITH